MQIEKYYQKTGSNLSFTRQQASDFAKKVAGDFNPIHDIDSKRFCVPGDLLFSVIIHEYGIRQNMTFNFSGMVNDGTSLILPVCDSEHLAVVDDKGKKYMAIECSGEVSRNNVLIESLSRHYVEFSSQAFPHILVPLMSEQNVMINPDRPLIIYESMSFHLDSLDFEHVELELTGNSLQVNGKRGDVTLEYTLFGDGENIGRGCKRMVLSGLRPFDKTRMDEVVEMYDQVKQNFIAA